ncbi:hypothetical protein ANAPC5_01296 [Anaplasma phagocytophilum]|nr:hypothetical protein ANAPC5_01296 [Anaplasma phagocytophilum]
MSTIKTSRTNTLTEKIGGELYLKIYIVRGMNYCKRLNFRGLQFPRIGPKLKIRNYSRVLIFANQA